MLNSRFRLPALMLSAVGLAPAAEVNVPPGYYLVDVYSSGFNRWTSINNSGQIVWEHADDPAVRGDYDIMMYDKATGQVTKITDDSNFDIYDGLPDINDAGTIVWCRAIGPGPINVVQFQDGQLSYITDESASATPRDNSGARINDAGTVVWTRYTGGQCATADGEIWTYSVGEPARQLTSVGLSNQGARLNSAGDVIWTQYNFCESPWHSRIMMYSNGNVFAVSPPTDSQPQTATIDDVGTIGWSYAPSVGEPSGVSIIRDGIRERFAAPSSLLMLSRTGSLTFSRWYSESATFQLWVRYADSELFQLTNGPGRNLNGAINDAGEIAWVSGVFPNTPIRAILRRGAGDVNCDGSVTIGDIAPFVLGLIDPAGYPEQFPTCDLRLSDCSGDGFVTVADISCFIELLLGGQKAP